MRAVNSEEGGGAKARVGRGRLELSIEQIRTELSIKADPRLRELAASGSQEAGFTQPMYVGLTLEPVSVYGAAAGWNRHFKCPSRDMVGMLEHLLLFLIHVKQVCTLLWDTQMSCQ